MITPPDQTEIEEIARRCHAAGFPRWNLGPDAGNAWFAQAETEDRTRRYTSTGPSAVEAMRALVRAIEGDQAKSPAPPLPKGRSWDADFALLVDDRVGAKYAAVRCEAAMDLGADLLRQVAELTAKLEARK